MSVVFHINNQKKGAGQAPVLTVAECLDLVEGLIQFGFDSDRVTRRSAKKCYIPANSRAVYIGRKMQ